MGLFRGLRIQWLVVQLVVVERGGKGEFRKGSKWRDYNVGIDMLRS